MYNAILLRMALIVLFFSTYFKWVNSILKMSTFNIKVGPILTHIFFRFQFTELILFYCILKIIKQNIKNVDFKFRFKTQ